MARLPVAAWALRLLAAWALRLLAAGAGLLPVACSRSAPPSTPSAATTAPAVAPALPVEPTVTLQELMRDVVDPAADALWEAVGSTTTRAGLVEKRPRTDADWAALRRHAVVLLESTNLLVIPGRKVSARPFPSDGPGVLGSQEIQARLDHHRDEVDGYAVALRAVVTQQLAAIDAHDADALLPLGEGLDQACEACHRANWYPHELIPPLPENPPLPGPLRAGAR